MFWGVLSRNDSLISLMQEKWKHLSATCMELFYSLDSFSQGVNDTMTVLTGWAVTLVGVVYVLVVACNYFCYRICELA